MASPPQVSCSRTSRLTRPGRCVHTPFGEWCGRWLGSLSSDFIRRALGLPWLCWNRNWITRGSTGGRWS